MAATAAMEAIPAALVALAAAFLDAMAASEAVFPAAMADTAAAPAVPVPLPRQRPPVAALVASTAAKFLQLNSSLLYLI